MNTKTRSLRRLLTAFGLAAVASLSLGAAGAFGAELPANIGVPTISSSPVYGKEISSSQGKWTGSPTGYTYEWYRCNASGAECASIGGPSESNYYLVAAADVGHTLKSKVTAYNEAGSGSAFSKATSVVPIPPEYWIAGGTKIAEGTPTGLLMAGSVFNVSFFLDHFGGLEIKVSCTSQTASGTVENPTGGGTGVGTNVQLTLEGCSVVVPKKNGCKVNGGKIKSNALSAETTMFEGKAAVRLVSEPEWPLFSVTIQECSYTPYNRTYNLTGSIVGVVNSATSSLEFTEASSPGFGWLGIRALFTGSGKLETTGGSTLTVAP